GADGGTAAAAGPSRRRGGRRPQEHYFGHGRRLWGGNSRVAACAERANGRHRCWRQECRYRRRCQGASFCLFLLPDPKRTRQQWQRRCRCWLDSPIASSGRQEGGSSSGGRIGGCSGSHRGGRSYRGSKDGGKRAGSSGESGGKSCTESGTVSAASTASTGARAVGADAAGACLCVLGGPQPPVGGLYHLHS
ncbi:unnamed protein product, partial [Phaeothamnion confervicola]